jgi:chemotaxis signal transduction protein/HPt (histidine-containing phosphotransfer) domain-containing protein
MSEFGDLIPEFVEESLEHLKNIEEDIIIIEQGTADNELINRVFRAVHSIKGGSSFLGLKNIEHLSHKMEDIFNLVRNDELEFTSEVSSRILKSIDKLKELLEDSEESDSYDIEANLQELKKCLNDKSGGAGKKDKPEAVRTKEKDEEPAVKIDKDTFASLRKKGKKVYLIQFELKEESLGGKNPLDFFNEIEKTGEVLVRNVDMELVLKDDNFTGEGIPMSILYATVLERDLVAHIFGIDEETVKEIKPDSTIEMEVLEDARGKKTGLEVDSFLSRKQARIEAEKPGIDLEDEAITVRDISTVGKATAKPLQNGETVEPIEAAAEEGGGIIDLEEEDEEDSDSLKDTNEYLTFKVGDEEYGIGITQVHEIVTLHEITPVPSAENFTKGILNLRGDIIPVYDFRLRLTFDTREYDHETVILIVMIRDKKVGVIVDRVSEVIQLNREQISDAPQMQQIPSNFIIGIGQKEGKFVILLKLKEIFNLGEAA